MDATSLQTLNLTRSPLHLRPAALARAFPFSCSRRRLMPPQSYRYGSPLSLHSAPRSGISSTEGGDEASGSVPQAKSGKKLFQVVLVSPQIAGNTGCIARTCAASAVGLHLVEPLGYKEGDKRLLAFTKRGTRIHSGFSYKPGDWLVFGSETTGLPAEVLLDCNGESMGGGTIRIPMVETYVRCLNLSVSVGIALYEASRQLNYEQLRWPPMAGEEGQRLFISEDIYA